MTRNNDLLALLDSIKQSAERIFGLECADLHRDSYKTSLS